ncbi:MAG: tetratricopeptide repeat protein, partial [Pseudomonadota bacterium]
MVAIRLTFLLICFVGFSQVSQARPVDVGGTLEEADRFGNQSAVSKALEPIAGTVTRAKRTLKPLAKKAKSTFDKMSSWLDTKRKAWFPTDEETELANLKEEARKKQAERKKKLDSLEAALPSYKTPDKGITKKQLEQAKKDVGKLGTSVVAPALAPDAKLPVNKSGIPYAEAFDKKKKGKRTIPVVKEKIALLNVGRPEQIAASDLSLQGFQPKKVEVQEAKALKSPEIYPEKKTLKVIASATYDLAKEPGDPRKAVKFESKLVTQKMVDEVQLVLGSEVPVDVKNYDKITANQFKMLAAMILYKKGNKCELLLGLFEELRDVDDLRNPATFHLGACAQKLKLYSTAYHYLSKLIKTENADFAEKSLLILAKDLPRDYETEFAKMVLALKNKGIITKSIQDAVFYRVAKGSFHKGDMKTAKLYAKKVSERSEFSKDARFVKAVADYALGQMGEAEAELKGLRKQLAREGSSDKNMLSLTAVNLARIQFQQGKYAAAVKTFGKVKKSHSLWVTALVEQGWAQIMVEDPAGAIGNMYSLHSPFF